MNKGIRMKWNLDYIWKAYPLAEGGLKDREIARSLGVNIRLFKTWIKKYPALANSIEDARKSRKERKEFDLREFVVGRLPAHLLEYWDHLHSSGEELDGEEFKSIHDLDTESKQALWLHAWHELDFNKSGACRELGINVNDVQHWEQHNPIFCELVKHMQTVKKDFVESKAMHLVRKGNALAVVAMNKTLNRDRGYGDKVDVNHSGAIQHNMNVVDIERLELSVRVQRALLDAVRKRKELDKHVVEGGRLVNATALN